MNSLEECLEELKTITQMPRLYLSKYFTDLRTQVDLDYAAISINKDISNENKDQSNKLWTEMIDKINHFEQEVLRNIPKNGFKTIDLKRPKRKNLKLIERVTNELQKKLFLDQTILYLSKETCKNTELFQNSKFNNILLHLKDVFINSKDIDLLKNKKIAINFLTKERILLFQLEKSMPKFEKQLNELVSIESNAIELEIILTNITIINLSSFLKYSNLKILKINFNFNLKSIRSTALKDLNNLIELDLSYNRISIIKANTFNGLSNLKKLRLSQNEIKIIESNGFEGLTNLEVLRLHCNELTHIQPQTFLGMPKLKLLDLTSNTSLSFDSNSFSGLNSLERLYLRSCGLKKIKPYSFYTLTNLESLILNSNVLSSFDSKSFRGLEKLRFMHLAENKIKSIKEYQLKEFVKLYLMTEEDMIIAKSKKETFYAKDYQMKDFQTFYMSSVSLASLQPNNNDDFQTLCSCQIL